MGLILHLLTTEDGVGPRIPRRYLASKEKPTIPEDFEMAGKVKASCVMSSDFLDSESIDFLDSESS
ncbi:hypothetical protein CU043_10325 [Corynebacterium striatum]|nr:hypothetical protein [Corynebacterium striatum]